MEAPPPNPVAEPQFKLTLAATKHAVKVSLRSHEESLQGLQQLLTNIRTAADTGCPFLVDCYLLEKVSEEEWAARVAHTASSLEAYHRKDVPTRVRLALVDQLLNALIVLKELRLSCLRISPSYVQIAIQEGEPVAKLPTLELWRSDSSTRELLSNSLQVYLGDRKSELNCYPPELQRKPTSIDMESTDLWMLSLTIMHILWHHEPLKIDFTTKGTKYCLEECNIQSTRLTPPIKRLKFHNQQPCLKLVERNLYFDPQQRTTTLAELKKAFRSAISAQHTSAVMPLDHKLLSSFVDKFAHEQQQFEHRHRVSSESHSFSLLDQQLANKMVTHFESCKKPLSRSERFKPFYKASAYGFSSKHFHEKCDMVRHLLIVFQTTTHHKFCAYSSVAFDLKAVQGLFGAYLPDQAHQSFLYANGEFFHLKDRTKAIAVAPNYGPVFGQTDIVTVDRNISNFTRLKSYQPKASTGKPRLLPHESFQLAEYEIYSVCFEQPQ